MNPNAQRMLYVYMGNNVDGGEHLSLKVISEARTVCTKCPGETNKQFIHSCRECDPTTVIDKVYR